MSDTDKSYKSRLARPQGAPLRGIGSGYTQNQAMAGVQDPEAAARLAAMSPADAELERERQERLAQDLDAMREDVFIAVTNGHWTPPADATGDTGPDIKDAAAWKRVLEDLPAETLQAWAKQLNRHLDDAVEAESEEELKAALQQEITIDPGDPLYDPLRDKDRKTRIEAGLKPLDFEEMVFKGYCTQDVEMRKGFVATYRTIPTQHGLWIEFMMSQEPETSWQHTRHMFSLLQVAGSLDAINGKPLGSDITRLIKTSQRDEFIAAIRDRMEALGRLPSMLTDDLIVQYIWFTGRVRRLLSGDLMRKVGNS